MTPENVIEQWANYFNNADTKNILSLYHTSATLLPTFLPKLLTSNNGNKRLF
jgi:ketosteroid isomerase-like protein